MINAWHRRHRPGMATMSTFRLRRALAPLARLLAPGYGRCQHCHMPWRFANGHVVPYRPWRGVFFVCQTCWPLITADQMEQYAAQAVDSWDDPAREDALRAVAAVALARDLAKRRETP